MVSPASAFVIAMLVIVLGWLAIRVKPSLWPAYFSTKTGRGILKGIVLAILFGSLFALVGCQNGTYFNDASVYVGIDETKGRSPMCERSQADDNATSNLGLRLNVWEYEQLRINGKYQHHSGAFCEDAAGYDALGVELEYKFWER